jgi:hypothetical protein
VADPYEHGNVPSDSIKNLQFLNELRDYQFLNSEFCSMGLCRSKIKPSVVRNAMRSKESLGKAGQMFASCPGCVTVMERAHIY